MAKAQVSSDAVRIDGLAELNAALRAMGPAVRRGFNKEMRPVAQIVSNAVRAQVPVRSGAARASVRPSVSGGWLAIRAGGAKAPYYGWLDYGGTLRPVGGRRNTQRRPVFRDGRWIYPTIRRNRGRVQSAAEQVVARAKRRAGL